MAYSSYGKKIYASIKDLPQYTSIGNGDKIIVWNEARDGAAVVDYADLIIDLDHTTFKSTINQVITVASDIQAFTNTVTQEIEDIQEAITKIEDTINSELKARIKVLEFIIAIILGSNSYWLSSAGLDVLRNRFLVDGIAPGASTEEIESEEGKETYKWYNGLMSAVTSYIAKMTPGVSNDDILLQSKFRYKYIDGISTNSTADTTSLASKTTISTTNSDGTSSTTTITHG